MPAEQDKAVVRRFIEDVMSLGNLETADELIIPDHAIHDPTAESWIASDYLDLRRQLGAL
jgi:hypothetical protein